MTVRAKRRDGPAVTPGTRDRRALRAGDDLLADSRLRFLLEELSPARRPARAVNDDLGEGETMTEPSPADGEPDPPGARPDSRLEAARDFVAGHTLVVAVVVGLAIALALFWALRARPVALATPAAAPSVSTKAPPVVSPTPTPVPTILVHVLGAVRRPGVVRLHQGARVQDAIAAAGGATKDARPGTLNLAQVLTDGQQLLIGSVSDPTSQVRGGAGPAPGAAGTADGRRLDLNSATAAQLEQLPGVGPVTATSILQWRTTHGRFARVEQLQEIDGIGPKTFARIEPYVRV